METKLWKLVLPGDVIPLPTRSTPPLLGPGLTSDGSNFMITNAGIFKSFAEKNYFWVDFPQKRYVPSVGDLVLGVVHSRTTEHYEIELNSSSFGILPILAFDGATKSNRPNLEVDSSVYCRVQSATTGLCSDLDCSTSGLGPIDGGLVSECTVNLTRELLLPNCFVLNCIGKVVGFEIAVGVNGRFWINADSMENVVKITNAILLSEGLQENQIQELVSKLSF